MKTNRDDRNPDQGEPTEKRFKSNDHQAPTAGVKPLATQQPSKTAQTPPQTATVPEKKAAEQKPLEPPAKPVLSTRRVLIANLEGALNPQVKKIVTERADVMRGNYKLVRTAEPVVRLKELPVPVKEANRSTAVQIYENLERVRQERAKDARLSGPVQESNSALIIQGKGQSVTQAFKDLTTDKQKRKLLEALGPRKGKVSTEQNEVRAVNPGFKIGSQALQLLGHLSQAFMNKKEDMEYQAMLVNDRIFVAANDHAAIESFAGASLRDLLAEGTRHTVLDFALDTASKAKVRAYKIGALCAALKLDKDSTVKLTTVQEDGAKMLAEYALGHHIDHTTRKPLQSLLNILKHQVDNGPTMVGPFVPDVAKDYVRDPNYKYKVILVKTKVLNGWHAEQALVHTLTLAGWQTGAFVSGTKLPCYGCWLTLNLLPQRGYPLSFTQKPGFIWGTTMSGLTAVAKQLGVESVEKLTEHFEKAFGYTDDRFTQYMTATKPKANLTVKVTPRQMGEAKSGLTQGMSPGSFYIAQKAPVTTSIAGTPYPDQVPGSPVHSYDTPPNSPRGKQDEALTADYDNKMKEYKSAQEKAAAAAAVKKETDGTTK